MNKDVDEKKSSKLAIVGFICMIIMFLLNMTYSVNVYMQLISVFPWLFTILAILIKRIYKQKPYSIIERIFLVLSFLFIVGFGMFLIWVLPQETGILYH